MRVLEVKDLSVTFRQDGRLIQAVKGVSCAHCHDLHTPEQKANLAERQRQTELAQARGEVHVGARMARREAGL